MSWTAKGFFFVTRSKVNMKYYVLKNYQRDWMTESGIPKYLLLH